jgi:hypothetical protein
MSSSSFNLAVSFDNPVFIGQGSNKNLYCKVLDSSNALLNTDLVPLSYSSSSTYDFSFNFPSNDQPLAGTVEVYMETDNTNPIPEGPLPGFSSSVAYGASDIPSVESITKNIDDSITILVTTFTPIGFNNQVIFTGPSQFISLPFGPQTGQNYTVNVETLPNGTYQYVFILLSTFFPFSPQRNFAFICSNLSGISIMSVDFSLPPSAPAPPAL